MPLCQEDSFRHGGLRVVIFPLCPAQSPAKGAMGTGGLSAPQLPHAVCWAVRQASWHRQTAHHITYLAVSRGKAAHL